MLESLAHSAQANSELPYTALASLFYHSGWQSLTAVLNLQICHAIFQEQSDTRFRAPRVPVHVREALL